LGKKGEQPLPLGFHLNVSRGAYSGKVIKGGLARGKKPLQGKGKRENKKQRGGGKGRGGGKDHRFRRTKNVSINPGVVCNHISRGMPEPDKMTGAEGIGDRRDRSSA